MKKIPNDSEVERALREARQAVSKALKGANQVAAQVLARGRYEEVETLVARGRLLKQFEGEVEALRKRWTELKRGEPTSSKTAGTPLWSFYQPVLQALVALGGEARRAAIETEVGKARGSQWPAGDSALNRAGRERWRVMVQRTRKRLVAEGWIEDRNGFEWKITAAGRRAAIRGVGSQLQGEMAK